MLRTDSKKFYSLLREKTTNMKKASSKKKMRTFGNKHMKKKVQHNEAGYRAKKPLLTNSKCGIESKI